jgi:DNA-binding MarR family transcriptional regulator
VLTTVAENAGLSQTGIVDKTGIDRSTLADIVRRLSKKGLLQRRRTKADARAYAVRLTDEGEELLRKVGPLAKKVDQRIAQAIGGGKDDFLDRLEAMIEKLQPVSRT